jgi:RNA polymerase sigma-70 factor (ECF subfamily)
MSETELLQRAQNDDQKAFSEILEQYKFSIYYMIRQIIGDSWIAEDLTMETFERAFKDIKNFVPDYKLITWIIKIGRNRAIDYLRRESKKPKFAELDDILLKYYNPEFVEHWNPEKEIIDKEETEILEKIIDNVNPVYKKAMDLWLDGNSCKEISKKLSMPIGTVCPNIRKARLEIKHTRIKMSQIPNISVENCMKLKTNLKRKPHKNRLTK